MLFWVIAALLTLGASLAVLLPLSRRGPTHAIEGSHDLEVYRDQLAELDRDAERGLIQPAEAEQARAEIARRILKADKAAAGFAAGAAVNRSGRAIGVAAVLAVPLVSWGIYAATGSPDLPSQPLAARLEKSPADSTVDELVARAEAHLVANPDDGKGWDVLAPIYARLGRYDEAVTAYRNAIRLSGADGARQSGLGEAIAVARRRRDHGGGAGSLQAGAGTRTRPAQGELLPRLGACAGRQGRRGRDGMAGDAGFAAGRLALARGGRAGDRRGRQQACRGTRTDAAARSTRRPACRTTTAQP